MIALATLSFLLGAMLFENLPDSLRHWKRKSGAKRGALSDIFIVLSWFSMDFLIADNIFGLNIGMCFLVAIVLSLAFHHAITLLLERAYR